MIQMLSNRSPSGGVGLVLIKCPPGFSFDCGIILMRRFLLIGLLLSWWPVLPAVADMVAASRAYRTGDYGLAMAEWKLDAANGNSDALFNIGQLYRQGKGVERDLARAMEYFRRSANLGHVAAEGNLGTLLYFQKPRRAKEALKWWGKAARGGDVRAQYMLGLVNANGEDIPKNVPRALMWLSLSAAGGFDSATEVRKALLKYVSPDMRRAAEAQARTLFPDADFSGLDASPPPLPAASTPGIPARAKKGPSATPPVPFLIQLGALASTNEATVEWRRLQRRQPVLLNDLEPFVSEVVTAGGRHLFRLRAGPFASRALAARRCSELATSGIGCFVASRPRS